MEDFSTLCLLGVFLLVAMVMLPRLMSAMGPRRYAERGDEMPRYDDDTVRGSGAFGAPAADRSEYDDPDVRSRGTFGPSGGSSGRRSGGIFGRRPSSGGRTNSPNIRSRGGFGGKR